MTVAARSARVKYIENGTTLSFGVPFRFSAPTDLVVRRMVVGGAIVTLDYGADYSVTGGSTDMGGTVALNAPSNGTTLLIRRVTDRAQDMSYTINDRFPAESHEDALDRLTMMAQEQDDDIGDIGGRALLAPEGEPGGSMPPLSERVGMLAVFAPDGGLDAVPSNWNAVDGYDDGLWNPALPITDDGVWG